MNPDPEKLRTLLEDVLPSSGDNCGPTSSDVLAMLRGERTRRRRVQNSAALLAIIAVVAGTMFWNHKPSHHENPVIVQAPSNAASIVIHRVNDEQLFALLQETPAALMKMPDGSSTLFIIEQP